MRLENDSKMKKLSIVIVSWNTRDLLVECLDSVESSLGDWLPQGLVETFVVDNASRDDSVAAVKAKFPWVTLIENVNNVGFAAANNQALLACTGETVLLLNPDTRVLGDALRLLVRFLDEHPDAGAVGPRLLNADGSLQTSCYPAPTLGREMSRMFHLDAVRPVGIYRMEEWSTTTPRVVDVIQGACLLLRRSIIEAVGVLDESYFMYSEEVDLCMRVQRAQWKLYWVPEAEVVHYGGQSSRQVATPMFLQLYQSKVLLFRKYHGEPSVSAYKGVLFAAALARLAVSPLALLERQPGRDRHLTLANRYWHLLTALPRM